MEWAEVINDPALQNLPFKIELNKFGQVLMSPASNKHGILQSEAVVYLRSHFDSGKVIVECSIDTSDGVKVADVAWASDAFMERNGCLTPYPEAPEICIEIISPSNSMAEMQQKIELYLAKGAHEVWLCEESGHVRVFSHRGELTQSGKLNQQILFIA